MVAVLLSLGPPPPPKPTWLQDMYVTEIACKSLHSHLWWIWYIWFSKSGPSLSAESQGMGGYRLKHMLLTQCSQTEEEERKPQGDKEIFEVTLRTLWSFSSKSKNWFVLYVWNWPHNFTFHDQVYCSEYTQSPSRETLMFKENVFFSCFFFFFTYYWKAHCFCEGTG